ncbi:WD40_repeat protein [Hexamita inflata]|uniref:WD40 repeat protein n=1 Tax=Hexamita inflata TaxID=28002 RepID=A0AA86TRK8_9EUKA|nr:WD40 repeat protein [Hexamita inflata]CAI9925916.1 WD40 repeat protein [Hexamita inflata]
MQSTSLVELAAIPPGAQIHSPSSLVCTEQYMIYTSVHSIYVYQRYPQVLFTKSIQINNTAIAALTANEQFIAVACMDMRIHFYDIKTFEPTREVLLARSDPPIAVQYHPHFPETILLLYQGDSNADLMGELRSINIVSGQSFTLVTALEDPINMVCSPHKSEIAITGNDGHIRIYGIDGDGSIVYERMVLYSTLRIFNEASPLAIDVQQDNSESSKMLHQLIQDYLEAQSGKSSIACKQIAYDSKANDYFVACWECGMHALFSSKSGQALQVFEPNMGGIASVVYSPTASGKFYTTDATAGIYREWNVSQQKCLKEVRIGQDCLYRAYITVKKGPKPVDVLYFIDTLGKIYVVEDGTLIYETSICHSQAVLDVKFFNNAVLSASNDGHCRLFDAQNFSGLKSSKETTFTLRATEYATDSKTISSQIVQTRPCMCVESFGDVIINGYENGLIMAYDSKTGRPLSNIFTPSVQLSSTFADSLAEIIVETTQNPLQPKVRPDFAKLKCMCINGQYLYSGWRDGCIRIMKIQYVESKTLGQYIGSSFVVCLNLLKLASMSSAENLQVNSVCVLNNSLYAACHGGLFFVFDLTKFLQQTQNIGTLQVNDNSAVRTFTQLFYSQTYFCGNLNNKIQFNQVVTNTPRPQVDTTYSNRIFNCISASEPTSEEREYVQKLESAAPTAIVHLTDNTGVVATLFQMGTSQIAFKIGSVVTENFAENNRNTDKNLGFKFVKPVQPFIIVAGGAEGALMLINWQNPKQKIIAKLKSTKADLSSCAVKGNLILVGCYDGALKIISYNQTGLGSEDLLRNYVSNLVDKTDIQKSVLNNYFDESIYELQQLNEILEQKTVPSSQSRHIPVDQLLIRTKVQLFLLTCSFTQATACDGSILLNTLFSDLNKIYQGSNIGELQQNLLQQYPNEVQVNNMYITHNSSPNKLKLQIQFKMMLYLAVCLQDFQFVSNLTWIVGLYNQSVQIASYVSVDYFKIQATKLFKLRMIHSDTQTQIYQRWDLGQFIDDTLLKDIKTVKEFQTSPNTEKLEDYFKDLANNGKYVQAKLAVYLLNNTQENQQLLTHDLAEYYLSNGYPLQAAYEYLVEMMYDEAVRVLFMSGESLLAYYILNFIENNGFDQYMGLKLFILVDWVLKYGAKDSIESLLSYLSNDTYMNMQVDHSGYYVPQEVKISDITGLYLRTYSDALATQGQQIILSKSFDITVDYIAISHLLRKLAAAELYDSATIDNLQQSQKQLTLQQQKENVLNMRKNIGKYLSQTYKTLLFVMSKVIPTKESIQKQALPISFLSKHFQLTNIQCDEFQNTATKLPRIHLLLVAGACCVAKLGSIRGCRVFLSASLRAQRKMQLETFEILQELQTLGVSGSYEELRRAGEEKFSTQFNGRSMFEALDAKLFNIYLGFDKQLNWVLGWFG